MAYKFLDHTADIKLEVISSTKEGLFNEITKALADYLTGGKKIIQSTSREVQISGRDIQELIYKFIDEIIYLIDAERFVASSASVKIVNGLIKGTLKGDSIDAYKIQGVKAATYAEMDIQQTKKGWKASVVIDV